MYDCWQLNWLVTGCEDAKFGSENGPRIICDARLQGVVVLPSNTFAQSPLNVHLSREPSPDFSGPPFADSVVIYSYGSIETTYIVVRCLLLRSDEYDTTDMENASGLPLMCVPFSLILSPLCGLTRDNSVAFYSFRRHCLGRTHGGHVHEDRQDRSTGYCQ